MRLRPCYIFKDPERKKLEFRFLDGDLDEDGVRDFLVSLCVYGGDRGWTGTISEALPLLIERDSQVIGGGLAVIDDQIEFFPACCCGLEDWRDWFDVLHGEGPQWLGGHEPDQWVEIEGEHAQIHSESTESHDILKVDLVTLKLALEQAEQDLIEAVGRIHEVARAVSPQHTKELISRITGWFDVNVPGA
jgi:hypothetical protein